MRDAGAGIWPEIQASPTFGFQHLWKDISGGACGVARFHFRGNNWSGGVEEEEIRVRRGSQTVQTGQDS